MKRKLPLLSILIFLNTTFSYSETLDNPVIARVNGKVIYTDELYYELSRIEEQAMISGERNQIPLNYSQFEELREQIIQTMINKLLLLQECTRRSIYIDQPIIDQHFEYLKQQFPDEVQFKKFLDYSGISELKLKSEIGSSLCIDALAEMLMQEQGIPLTGATCRSYYEKNKELYTEPARYRINEIIIQGNPCDYEVKTIYEQLLRGKPFETLIQEYSNYSISVHGGDLGCHPLDALPEYIHTIIAHLSVGEISPIIEKDDKTCRILKLTDKTGMKKVPFDQAYQEIYQTLKNKQKLSLLAHLLTSLHKEATIIRE